MEIDVKVRNKNQSRNPSHFEIVFRFFYLLLLKIKFTIMKYLTLLLLSSSLFLNAQTNDESYNELLKKSPFNVMYPKYMAQEAAEYFTVFNTLFTEKSPIAPKEARLAAIAVSAAIKCEYCVSAQVHFS